MDCACGRPVLAKGLCRKCYDRSKYLVGRERFVRGVGGLSEVGRAFVRLVLAYREKYGRHPAVDELREGLPPEQQRAVQVGFLEAWRKGAVRYSVAPVWGEPVSECAKSGSDVAQNAQEAR